MPKPTQAIPLWVAAALLASGPEIQAVGGDTAANATHTQRIAMENQKRRVPKVEPVMQGGIRYEVLRGAKSRGFDHNGGVIAAVDAASGKERWTLAVYSTRYDPREEEDVQDVFITRLGLSPDGHWLIVENEAGGRYKVNLANRSIQQDAP